jgi:hypothetical protein
MKNIWRKQRSRYVSYLKGAARKARLIYRCTDLTQLVLDVAVSLDYVKKSKGMQGPTLLVTLTTSSHIQSGEIEIANAQVDIALLGHETPGFTALEIVGAVQNSNFVSVLGTLMESILKIGDEFTKVRYRLVSLVLTHHKLICIGPRTKIHPYANVAWIALTSVYKVSCCLM